MILRRRTIPAAVEEHCREEYLGIDKVAIS
jgi:hypothetical protein